MTSALSFVVSCHLLDVHLFLDMPIPRLSLFRRSSSSATPDSPPLDDHPDDTPTDGHDSDTSMPSLQTVSDSSEDETGFSDDDEEDDDDDGMASLQSVTDSEDEIDSVDGDLPHYVPPGDHRPPLAPLPPRPAPSSSPL